MIEPLESRIAPAAILTFTDSDGDAITVKASKGTDTQLATAVARDGLGNITAITLSNSIYEGSDFSIAAKIPHGGHGDGHIAVPVINAAGTDLGVVSIDGDVGSGAIGSNTAGTPAVKSFTAESIGVSNSSLAPLNFHGVVPSFTVKGDVGSFGALTFTAAGVVGNILGKATVDGNLDGGSAANGGLILVSGSADSIVVKGALLGGSAADTGAIEIVGGNTPTKVTVGSLLGGSGISSGSVRADGPLGAVTVTKNIVAGTNTLSGSIVSQTNIISVTVGQSILGNSSLDGEIAAGANVNSGTLDNSGNLGKVTVKGSIAGTGDALYSILADNALTSVSVAGDAFGASIESGGNLGTVTVGGNFINSQIYAHGTGSGLGIGSVAVHGLASNLFISSGHVVVSSQTQDINATIGSIVIAQEAVGVIIEAGSNTGISSQLNSVTIGGPAVDTGIFSNDLVKLTVAGAAAPLTPGANNDKSSFGGVSYDEI
jgi:hypothetical protein